MHAVTLEGSQALRQLFTETIKILINGLQAFRGNRFHPDQCSFDVRLLHGSKKLLVFRGFHGDLRVKDDIGGKLGQALHQIETLGASRLKFGQPLTVILTLRQREVSARHRIKIVVGQSDKTVA